MLLTVHDELLFEVEESAVEEVVAVIKEVMEGAAMPAVKIDVPMVVDAGKGANWAEAHEEPCRMASLPPKVTAGRA